MSAGTRKLEEGWKEFGRQKTKKDVGRLKVGKVVHFSEFVLKTSGCSMKNVGRRKSRKDVGRWKSRRDVGRKF